MVVGFATLLYFLDVYNILLSNPEEVSKAINLCIEPGFVTERLHLFSLGMLVHLNVALHFSLSLSFEREGGCFSSPCKKFIPGAGLLNRLLGTCAIFPIIIIVIEFQKDASTKMLFAIILLIIMLQFKSVVEFFAGLSWNTRINRSHRIVVLITMSIILSVNIFAQATKAFLFQYGAAGSHIIWSVLEFKDQNGMITWRCYKFQGGTFVQVVDAKLGRINKPRSHCL
jgi:hypothetical protein